MKNKSILFSLVIIGIMAILSCNHRICANVPGPQRFTFVTSDSADAFINGTYNIDSLKLYLLKDGVQTALSFGVDTVTNTGKTICVVSCFNIFSSSLESNTTTSFLFHLTSARTDTLTVHCNNISSSPCTGPSGNFDVPKYNWLPLEMEKTFYSYVIRL